MEQSFSFSVNKSNWSNVYTIPQGTTLRKGRHGKYKEITSAAGMVTDRFGCYCWGNETTVFYCGSFAQDYRHGDFQSNLHGRVHNYLQNHRQKDNGSKNTNLMVFENLNFYLQECSVSLKLFKFEMIEINDARVDFDTYTKDSGLVHTLEELLIYSYKRIGQCMWNRT